MTAALVKDFERIPMSQALASTLARAAEYASAQAHVEVTLEHLLLALTEDEDAEVVFATSNVNVGQLKIDVSEQLGRIEERLPLDQNATARVSPAVRRILEASAQAAQGRRKEINGAIVLAAIVGDGNSTAANLLRIQGLTFEAAIRALQNSLAAPASTTQKPQPAPQQQPAPPQIIPSSAATTGEAVAHERDPATAEDFLARARAKVQSRTTTGRPSPADINVVATNSPPRPQHDDAITQNQAVEAPQQQTAPPQLNPEGIAPAGVPPKPGKSQTSARKGINDATGAPSPRTGPPQPTPQPGSWAPPKPTRPPAPPQQPRPSRPPPPIPTNVATTAPPPHAPAPAPNTGTRPGLAPPPPPNAAPAAPPWPGPEPAQQPRNGGTYPHGASDPHLRLPQHGRAPNSPAYGTQFEAAASRPDIAQPRQPTVEAGQLVENIPRTMQVDVPAHAEISIAAAGITDLQGTLQGAGPAHRHDLMITKAMSVRLRAPDGGFFIETASPETQWIDQNLGIEADDYARWRWTVTPKTRGRKRLQAIISARTVGADGLAAETALPDQIIEVKVRANYAKNIKHLGGWTLAAIAGGIAARFGEQIWETSRTLIQSVMSGS